MLLLEIGPTSHLATVVLLQIGPYCSEGNLVKTPCATFLLLKIGVKTLFATVVVLDFGDFF